MVAWAGCMVAWAFCVGSDVRAAGTTTLKWSAQDFRELVDYINTQAVPVRTFSNLARS
jgi:hypothetical protein